MSEFRVEGYRAFQDNIPEEGNPYVGNTEEHEFWSTGWYEAYYEWYDQQESDEWAAPLNSWDD